jgi:hypothetical protein
VGSKPAELSSNGPLSQLLSSISNVLQYLFHFNIRFQRFHDDMQRLFSAKKNFSIVCRIVRLLHCRGRRLLGRSVNLRNTCEC